MKLLIFKLGEPELIGTEACTDYPKHSKSTVLLQYNVCSGLRLIYNCHFTLLTLKYFFCYQMLPPFYNLRARGFFNT